MEEGSFDEIALTKNTKYFAYLSAIAIYTEKDSFIQQIRRVYFKYSHVLSLHEHYTT